MKEPSTGKRDSTPPPDTPALTSRSGESSTCSTSTIATSAMTTTLQQHQHQEQNMEPQRQLLLRQLYIFGSISVTSYGAFLVLFLPWTALLALAIFVGSSTSIVYTIYQTILLEFQSIVQGRGFGDYLPESIYQQLVQTSLHEYMMDSSFYLEYRYLLLYFIPGITQEQLDAYLQRLPPRHRNALYRPGLGNFFGNDFMRIILGDRRWTPRLTTASQPRPAGLALENTPRQLFRGEEDEDDNSDIGLDVTESDMAGGLNDQQAGSLMKFLGLSPIISKPEIETPGMVVSQETAENAALEPALQREQDEEGLILSEAITAMTQSYTSSAVSSITGVFVQAVEYISPFVINAGMGVTSISAGAGLLGLWLGVFHPQRLSPPRPHFPQARTLWSSAIFGTASAGVMILIRSGVRRTMADARLNIKPEKEEEEDGKK